MKKVLLFAASIFALAACNKTADQPETATYEITVEATVDGSLTKALAQSGKSLNAVWGAADVVTVYNASNQSIGTLKPQSSGSASATLKGTVTASGLSAGSTLTLLAPKSSWLYSGQDGTFASVSSKYAYSKATVSVTSVSGSSVQTSAASFAPQQAIVKFTLVDGSNAPVNAEELEISTASGKLVRSFNSSMQALTGTISIEPADETNVIWASLRNDSGAADTYTLKATVGKKVYTAEKAGFKLENGSFYGITVKMAESVDDYTVAGAPASLFGTEWDATNTANDMVRQSDGTYVKVYNVKSVTDVAFKVVKNHDWGSAGVNNWPVDDISLTVGAGEFKVMFDPSTKKVTYTFVNPGVVTEVYTVAGAVKDGTTDVASFFGTAWDPTNTANDMVKQSDGTYAKSYSNVAAGTYMEFKVTVNHAWTKSYGYNGGSGNASHTMGKTGTLTIHFDPNTHYVTATED